MTSASTDNLGQIRWNIETTPPPKISDGKMARFGLHAPSSLIWGRGGISVPFYFVQDCRPSVRVHWVACGTCSVPRNFFPVGGGGGGGEGHPEVILEVIPEIIPEAIPGEALWLTGPHTFVRRNRSFSEVKNLTTGLLIDHLSERRNSCPL